MTVVVTGGSGFIGSHTVERLVSEHLVRILDIKEPTYPTLSAEFIRCDITRDDLERYIEPGDKILHLGAVAHFVTREKAAEAVKVNVYGTIRLLEAAMQRGASRFVFSSTGSVFAQDVEVPIREDSRTGPSIDNYYGWSKLQAEEWVRFFKSVIPFVNLRYAYVYGPRKDWGAIGTWLYHSIPNEERPKIFGGTQVNDFIYVKDVVEANVLALETDNLNQTYNIGTGRGTSVLTACDLCLRATGSPLHPEIIPARSFDYPAFFYDIAKAQVLLDYAPKFDIYDGINDMVREMRK